MEVSIPAAKASDATSQSYTLYEVRVSAGGKAWTVEHRYSEFSDLRSKLVKGVKLPPFPAKKWFGNSEKKVIEERRAQLQNFLQAVIATPECHDDPAVAAFLNAEEYLESLQQTNKATDPAESWTGRDNVRSLVENAGPSDSDVAAMGDEEFREHLQAKTMESLIDGPGPCKPPTAPVMNLLYMASVWSATGR